MMQENFNKFIDTIAYSGLFKTENVKMRVSGRNGVATIPTNGQQIMDDVLEQLATIVEINVLYNCKSGEGRARQAVAYSMPYQDQMFAIKMESQQHGIVERMQVVFFDSMETMLERLQISLKQISMKKVIFTEHETLTQLYRNFM